jgi:hypothetical protein
MQMQEQPLLVGTMAHGGGINPRVQATTHDQTTAVLEDAPGLKILAVGAPGSRVKGVIHHDIVVQRQDRIDRAQRIRQAQMELAGTIRTPIRRAQPLDNEMVEFTFRPDGEHI